MLLNCVFIHFHVLHNVNIFVYLFACYWLITVQCSFTVCIGLNIFLRYCLLLQNLKHVIPDLFKMFDLVILHVLFSVYDRVLHSLICSAVH